LFLSCANSYFSQHLYEGSPNKILAGHIERTTNIAAAHHCTCYTLNGDIFHNTLSLYITLYTWFTNYLQGQIYLIVIFIYLTAVFLLKYLALTLDNWISSPQNMLPELHPVETGRCKMYRYIKKGSPMHVALTYAKYIGIYATIFYNFLSGAKFKLFHSEYIHLRWPGGSHACEHRHQWGFKLLLSYLPARCHPMKTGQRGAYF
jgi:hypothetical protein